MIAWIILYNNNNNIYIYIILYMTKEECGKNKTEQIEWVMTDVIKLWSFLCIDYLSVNGSATMELTLK